MDVVERTQLPVERALDHWYYRAKFELLRQHLRPGNALARGRRIADIGCGLGLFLTFLENAQGVAPENLLGIDPAYEAPALAEGGRATILPAWPEKCEVDVALLMDVLEHTSDDQTVLREAAGHVAPGGSLFITVPAFPWLFSAHDRFLGHYRRYTCRSLRELILASGDLEITELHYYYAAIFPAAVPWRLARRKASTSQHSDLRPLPKWLNWLLRGLTAAERSFCRWNRFFGLSAVALCRKLPLPATRTSPNRPSGATLLQQSPTFREPILHSSHMRR